MRKNLLIDTYHVDLETQSHYHQYVDIIHHLNQQEENIISQALIDVCQRFLENALILNKGFSDILKFWNIYSPDLKSHVHNVLLNNGVIPNHVLVNQICNILQSLKTSSQEVAALTFSYDTSPQLLT